MLKSKRNIIILGILTLGAGVAVLFRKRPRRRYIHINGK